MNYDFESPALKYRELLDYVNVAFHFFSENLRQIFYDLHDSPKSVIEIATVTRIEILSICKGVYFECLWLRSWKGQYFVVKVRVHRFSVAVTVKFVSSSFLIYFAECVLLLSVRKWLLYIGQFQTIRIKLESFDA